MSDNGQCQQYTLMDDEQITALRDSFDQRILNPNLTKPSSVDWDASVPCEVQCMLVEMRRKIDNAVHIPEALLPEDAVSAAMEMATVLACRTGTVGKHGVDYLQSEWLKQRAEEKNYQSRPVVAIIGAGDAVGAALSQLLQSKGFDAISVDSSIVLHSRDMPTGTYAEEPKPIALVGSPARRVGKRRLLLSAMAAQVAMELHPPTDVISEAVDLDAIMPLPAMVECRAQADTRRKSKHNKEYRQQRKNANVRHGRANNYRCRGRGR